MYTDKIADDEKQLLYQHAWPEIVTIPQPHSEACL